tara:strand:- start:3837 stop:4166 length:330 start_codon:yes stop_codon:yes gene_type:complete
MHGGCTNNIDIVFTENGFPILLVQRMLPENVPISIVCDGEGLSIHLDGHVVASAHNVDSPFLSAILTFAGHDIGLIAYSDFECIPETITHLARVKDFGAVSAQKTVGAE